MNSNLLGCRIHINGIVQGVGFRPFVFGLAQELNLKGWVRNTSAGVDIVIDGPKDSLSRFIYSLENSPPPLALVSSVEVNWQVSSGFAQFEIIPSEPIPGAFQPISPDVSTCPDCLEELFDPADRRYRYPFINCTNCGPRFTIIKDIPYDRPLTTMAPFAMCEDCASEYKDPADRRFHAQPVACPACGPKIWIEENQSDDSSLIGERALQKARERLREGKIIAVKGLGGFHLACDATNKEAVSMLRERKLRVGKPFALMMSDLDTVKRHAVLFESERKLLESRERPIVILQRSEESTLAREIAPGQNTIGVMLPYTPLHRLLLEKESGFPEALVMTSGNLSEEPIVTSNEEARQRLSILADAFLMHDRGIQTRCDDSVVRYFPAAISNTAEDPRSNLYPLRRARGYAPFPLELPWKFPNITAGGSELKNTVCFTRDRHAIISHHIGDLENFETLKAFETSIKHYERLFRTQPDVLAYDLHPDYLATRYILARSQEEDLPAVGIQHHHAHIAAAMAERGLKGDQPVIGVSFDGTGYGDDGAIWGGEFLMADYTGYDRLFHLSYTPLPGGDSAVKEPWRASLAWLHSLAIPWRESLAPVQEAIHKSEGGLDHLELLHRQLVSGLNSPLTSSMGRLFDAVASLAGIRQAITYEAQAAIELEALVDASEEGAYTFDIDGDIVYPAAMFTDLISDIDKKVPIPKIAARFHNGLSQMVAAACQDIRKTRQINLVALSGGVWQNMTMLTKTVALLRKNNFQVIMHRKVPANDGGISLGQAAVAAAKFASGEY